MDENVQASSDEHSATGSKGTLSENDWTFLRKLKEFVRSEGAAFLRDPNITSVGIGYRTKDGKPQTTEDGKPQLAIQFTVRRKAKGARGTPELDAELEALGSRLIPPEMEIADTGVRVETDVVERAYEPAYELVGEREIEQDERKKRRPVLVPGISVGHPKTTAGTMGAVVYDAHTGSPCALSNWHVLHTPEGELGDPMLQPGPHDDNRTDQNRAGTLVRSHLGMAGDCAIARIEGREFDPTILDLNVRVSELARPELGDRVVKSGRTTDVTYGIVRRIETIVKLDYGGTVGERMIGGFEIGPDDLRPAPGNEISKGGDSGSAWLIVSENGKATGIMVGLHFGGEGPTNPDEHALACYAHAVFEKLEIALAEPPAEARDSEPEVSRTGFNELFLSAPISVPCLKDEVEQDVVKLNGSHLIPYTHFTVCLSKSRRMARFVAWNIDGEHIKKVRRPDDFDFDPRIDPEYQIGNDVYVDNRLDRGHIARRADLAWGHGGEAKQATTDSFYFTNVAPQHQAFNQSSRGGLWGQLENAIFDEVDIQDLRVSVMGGPVLKAMDPVYREIQIPRSFWKLIAYVEAGESTPKIRAFIISQDDLLNDIEALELDEFRVWQVSVSELESRTHLEFHLPPDADTGVPETVAERESRVAVREVCTREDLRQCYLRRLLH